ncbi:MAG: DUF4340 domain-containing protein [Candidatus Omnitrophica bacterium]|nr:DUF4340 domain-containing protein [Candidatus Omnitrophota bacterium]
MKKSQIIFLLVLLMALVALVVFKKSRVPPELTREEYAELVVDLRDTESVQGIDIHQGADEQPLLRLVRSGEYWSMPLRWDLPVQQKKVTDALNMLKDLKGELRGSDEKLFGDFGIENDKAYHIKMKGLDDKELLHLLIGIEKPTYGSSFVRMADSAKVYLVDYNLMVTFGITSGDVKTIDEKQWADLKTPDFNNTDVTGIRIEKRPEGGSAQVVELSKSTDAESGLARWAFARLDLPFSVDAGKVSQYLDEIKRVTGIDFHDPAGTEYGFDNFHMTVTLDADSEDKKKLYTVGGVSSSGSESRYMRVEEGRPVLTISKYSLKSMDVDESYFFPANPFGIDKEKTASVSIHKPDSEKKIESEKFDEETALINALKELSATRLLNADESRKVKPGSEKFWIEVVPKEGEPQQVDVGEVLGEGKDEYAVRLRNGTTAFAISKNIYQRVFET